MNRTKSGRIIKIRNLYSPNIATKNSFKKKVVKWKSENAKQFFKKKKQKNSEVLLENKTKFIETAVQFGQQLAKEFNNPLASQFFCSAFSSRPCQCLQSILSNQDHRIIQERLERLLLLMKQAEALHQLKCYDPLDKNKPGTKCIGLGNGHKKNEKYVKFVLQHRQYLRNDLKLCEKATKKILCYSNNFLHKKLKTEPGHSSRLIKHKSLIPIMDLPEILCCKGNCVKVAKTHPSLLESWRDRASLDQSEARRVIGEMLTPCRGDSRNCFKFIIHVTGCSFGTISKVNMCMRNSGGCRDPPEHGLKRWWREQSKKTDVESNEEISDRSQLILQSQLQSDHELEIDSIFQGVPVSSMQMNSSDLLSSTFPSQINENEKLVNLVCTGQKLPLLNQG